MGVSKTDYLIYGVRLDPKLVDWDKHEAMISGTPDAPFNLIYDGMSGKYAVAGHIIASADQYDGIEFTEITEALLPQDTVALREAIEKSFGVPVEKMSLYLFSHFS